MHGEWSILTLMALIGIARGRRFAIIAIDLFGAALIYGDGAITPAISVLSALEGLNITIPAVQPYTFGLPGWLEALFALMQRNSVHVSDFLLRLVARSRFDAPRLRSS